LGHKRLLTPFIITVLVNGPPEILALPLNGHKHFVDVPRIARTPLPLFEFASIVRPKLLTPLTDRFICDGDSTLGK
jgi:hypothetical protein